MLYENISSATFWFLFPPLHPRKYSWDKKTPIYLIFKPASLNKPPPATEEASLSGCDLTRHVSRQRDVTALQQNRS